MRRVLCALALSAAALPVLAQAPAKPPTVSQTATGAATQIAAKTADDPFLWLEEVEGERALNQVRAWNDRTLAVLQADPRYADLHGKALEIVNAVDRIPVPEFRARAVDNFWQDKTNVRGLWRRTTLDSYRTDAPTWDVVLDLDALSAAEKANWVYKGAECLEPDERLCLLRLSNGGKDAVEVREFDAVAKTFVPNGFRLPEGKQDVTWVDADTLLVARDWGPGTMTESGYAFVVKRLKRGAALDQAVELYRGTPEDVAVSTTALRDPEGRLKGVMITRAVSFFETEYFLLDGDTPVRLPLPVKSSFQAFVDGQLVFTLEQPWTHGGDSFQTGALLSLDLGQLKRDPAAARAVLIRQPGPRESIEQVSSTRGRLIVAVYENVRGGLYGYTHADGAWRATRYDLPENTSIGVVTAREEDDALFVSVTGFLQPTSLYQGDAVTGRFAKVKQLPPRFDASNAVVEQFEATSRDGTKIPYFVTRPKDAKLDGSNPTLLYAYGGFQVSMTPAYSAMNGKLWVERGGVYVLANIRGGGEFGPAWHQAGLKTNRQLVFDDFTAVARDLIARKVTSPRRLGIQGGSNGGLLMGAALTQTPELYNAAVVQVPLLDMLRYHKLLAGASWVGEYGDPDVPAEAAYIATYSPYQRLRGELKLPEPFIVTSTKDDRVHPGHARKFAAKLEQLGKPFLYYENIDGGHAAAANLQETAKRVALEYTYLTRKLMD
jgi:prolyl oligopeptidase